MDIKYEVILTTQAKMELNNIYKYISNFLFAPKAAQKFIDKFKTSILRLEHLPKSELFKILIRHSLQTWIHIVKN